jgi:hypothetical protein
MAMAGMNSDSDSGKSAKKEWRRPALRKLPIAATAQGKSRISFDDGNTKKVGTAGVMS